MLNTVSTSRALVLARLEQTSDLSWSMGVFASVSLLLGGEKREPQRS